MHTFQPNMSVCYYTHIGAFQHGMIYKSMFIFLKAKPQKEKLDQGYIYNVRSHN